MPACGSPARRSPGDIAVKLNNMKIGLKLGILVAVAMLGLCVAGGLAGYLMQQEMLERAHRSDQGDRRAWPRTWRAS